MFFFLKISIFKFVLFEFLLCRFKHSMFRAAKNRRSECCTTKTYCRYSKIVVIPFKKITEKEKIELIKIVKINIFKIEIKLSRGGVAIIIETSRKL